MSKAVSELPTLEVGLSTYEKLAAVNVSAHIEKKNNLNYLSWSWALDQLLRQDPNANWHYHWWDAKPYCVIDDTAMVFCSVTAFGVERTAQLAVMDNRMKSVPLPIDSQTLKRRTMRALAKVISFHAAEILSQCIHNAHSFDVEGIFSVYDIAEDLKVNYKDELPKGESTSWANIDELYSPTPAQWTLVTGIPSMGKSEWLDALTVNLAPQSGWVIGVCSPENQPISWHSAKLIEKHMGKRIRNMSRDEFESAKDWLNQHFHFILPEEPTIEAVLDKAKVLVQRFGMRGLVIDPYNELDHTRRKEGVNETEYVSSFLTYIRKFAREQWVHVWLVAHPAKPMKDRDGNYPVPDVYSVSGSAHFFNKADNIIAVHRDKTNPKTTNEIHVQKIRSRWLGRQGISELYWKPDSGRHVFENIFQPTRKDFASVEKRHAEALNF